ncbi:hypothetical protein H8356DRAFT_940715 [Neocallimastix lanati (nom. inval.)]|uniref:CBM10 domain-containing protein n=1 Tax=Neocallimastix californiae TaxID=1754190 RepID=A0A1Y2A7X0_9FUNG|nr:hypothetical protein H8356DRAFT_940715 [Neocallimastix sp. JGI-2020a]ORY18430.1 hypothetical protein LY90DRAFT_435599 [Neocallimastix californiae]|eukprot:ORY18430.1 hypothetical protein LY90DRAFT_435599 [Neocallimastix californiae]
MKGYHCCKLCNISYSDDSGDWGVENNEWCGIPDSCKEKPVAETCTGSNDGYSCCKTCNVAYTDDQGDW